MSVTQFWEITWYCVQVIMNVRSVLSCSNPNGMCTHDLHYLTCGGQGWSIFVFLVKGPKPHHRDNKINVRCEVIDRSTSMTVSYGELGYSIMLTLIYFILFKKYFLWVFMYLYVCIINYCTWHHLNCKQYKIKRIILMFSKQCGFSLNL